MSLALVFNHHSLPFSSRQAAVDNLPGFMKICLKANNHGYSTVLVDENIDSNWHRIELSSGFFFQDWFQQNRAEKVDLIRAFRSITTRQPFFDKPDIDNNVELFEVFFEESNDYSALRAAAWHEAPLASFPSNPPWLQAKLNVCINTLDEDSQVVSSQTELVNLYSHNNLENDFNELIQKRNAEIASGKDLLANFSDYFPGLRLCEKAGSQLACWSASQNLWHQVKESLAALNRFSEKWANNEFLDYSHENLKSSGLSKEVSGESEKVRNDTRLRKEREFFLSTGIKAFFENHIKLSKGYRIHFYPCNEEKIIYIGYIGPHLKL
ncbi:MAG: hypothetical protein AB1403_19505 [Candidatus Riflebacteria bacterium]